MLVALTALQELVMRPLTRTSRRTDKTQKVFFACTVGQACLFLGMLLYNHCSEQPARNTLQRSFMWWAVYYASYVNEALQLMHRRVDFSPAYHKAMLTHHLLSLTGVTAWLLGAAPIDPEGAPLFNTVSGSALVTNGRRQPHSIDRGSCRSWSF